MGKTNECHEVTFLAGEECLYSVVKRSAVSLGWKVIGEEASDKVKRDCHVIWVDKSFANDKRFISIQPWQRINHFPGMTNICRKIRLAQSLELMKKKFPREYSFFPTTYVLPLNLAAFRSLFHNGQSTSTYIVKPDGSAQGKGIFLTKRIEDVENLNTMCVAQQYIKNPLLIDKKKFDLRIYVLVTSCCPLRIYLFRDGLVRMCTEEYKHPTDRNLRDKCMHLTNYSINKRSDKYQRDGKESTPSNTGNKRTISWLLNWLSRERGEAAANDLWAKIGDICVMTILSILPTLRREYDTVFGKTKLPTNEGQESNKSGSSGNRTIQKSRCFELLGVDIMIDTKLNPILIEVNHLPSWGTDSSVDELIKSRVIVQALSAINVKLYEKKAYERARRKQSRLRLRKMRQPVDGDSARDGDDLPIQSDIAAKRKRTDLFDSNSAERKIRTIYETYAPEKLPHVKDLINKYRGYEDWLVMRVEEKYVQSTDDSSNGCCANDDIDDDGDDDVTSSDDSGEEEEEEDCIIEESEREILSEEDRILEDYDRIYPPKGNSRISLSRYKEMEQFVSDTDEERQRRLTCPLHEMRSNNCQVVQNEFGTHGNLNRGEGWIGGNVHVRQNRQEPKVFAPPTKQQIECASRLFQGFSVEDTDITTRSLNRKSRLLHHNLIDLEESNPFYHLIDRVREARELSKQARDRAEKRLSHRGIKGSTSVRGQNLDLAVDLPIVAARNVFAPSVKLK